MVFPNLQLIHVHSPNDLLRSNSDRHPLWRHSECSKLSMRTMSHMMIHTLVEGSLVKSIGPHSGSACPRTSRASYTFCNVESGCLCQASCRASERLTK